MLREYWKPWIATPEPEMPGVMMVPIHGWINRRRAVVAHALVDETDLPLIRDCYWSLSRGYPKGCVAGQSSAKMHRVILGLKSPHLYVDHINRDPLDNRRSNLRVVTPQQNAFNMRSKGVTSRYKGVSYCKRTGRWMAQITLSYRNHFLGRHQTEEEAARAYDRAAAQMHGVHALLNFPAEARR